MEEFGTQVDQKVGLCLILGFHLSDLLFDEGHYGEHSDEYDNLKGKPRFLTRDHYLKLP